MNIQIGRRLALASMGLLLTFLAAPLLPAHAQSPPPPASAGPTLTPAQQAKYKVRAAKLQKALQALNGNKSLSAAQKQAKFQTLVKAYQADILTYLTPAQRAQVKTMQGRQAVMGKKRDAFIKAHKAEINQVKALGDQVNNTLTPAQKSQIASVRQSAQQQAQTIMSNNSLSNAAKQQQIQALQADAESKTMAVLNPAQQAKVKQILAIQKKLAAEAQAAAH